VSQSQQDGIQGTSWDDSISISSGSDSTDDSDVCSPPFDVDFPPLDVDLPPLDDIFGLTGVSQKSRDSGTTIPGMTSLVPGQSGRLTCLLVGDRTVALGGAACGRREEVANIETGEKDGLDRAPSVPLEPATSRSQEDGIQGTSRDDAISISSGDNSDDSVSDFSPLPNDSTGLSGVSADCQVRHETILGMYFLLAGCVPAF
jgi:hypothetical protein